MKLYVQLSIPMRRYATRRRPWKVMLGEEFKGKRNKILPKERDKSLTFQHKSPRNHSKMNPSGSGRERGIAWYPKLLIKVSFHTNMLEVNYNSHSLAFSYLMGLRMGKKLTIS